MKKYILIGLFFIIIFKAIRPAAEAEMLEIERAHKELIAKYRSELKQKREDPNALRRKAAFNSLAEFNEDDEDIEIKHKEELKKKLANEENIEDIYFGYDPIYTLISYYSTMIILDSKVSKGDYAYIFTFFTQNGEFMGWLRINNTLTELSSKRAQITHDAHRKRIEDYEPEPYLQFVYAVYDFGKNRNVFANENTLYFGKNVKSIDLFPLVSLFEELQMQQHSTSKRKFKHSVTTKALFTINKCYDLLNNTELPGSVISSQDEYPKELGKTSELKYSTVAKLDLNQINTGKASPKYENKIAKADDGCCVIL